MRLPRCGSILATAAMLLVAAPAARAQDEIAVEASGDIWVVEADGSQPRDLTATPEPEQHPAWSQDGARIAFTRDGQARVIGADGSGEQQLLDAPGVVGIDWARSGRIAYIVRDADTDVRTVFIADRHGNDPRQVATGVA